MFINNLGAEIALRPNSFCNLTEISAGDIIDQQDLNERAVAAAFIGTLQAGYTDFYYLRDIWKRTTEKDALIGVSMTGIASGAVMGLDMKAAAKLVKEENARVAKEIGINPAARQTTVKPAGTTSLVLGTSSGVHAWHNDYYIRRLRVGKNEGIYSYLALYHPELLEDEYFRPHDTAVISVPQKAPEGAVLRYESPLETLERVKKIHDDWIKEGHNNGQNTHNVSCFSGDTKFIAEGHGYKRFDEFNDGDTVNVLTYDGTYTPGIVKTFGRQEIVEIDVVKGKKLDPYTIKTTAHHWWYVANNYKRYNKNKDGIVGYNTLKTKDLMSVAKAQIPRVFPTHGERSIVLEGLLHGIVYGDGTRTKVEQKNGKGSSISLCHDSRMLKSFFVEAGYEVKEHDSINQTYIGKLPWAWKDLPESKNPDYVYSFIAGWFAADGHVPKDLRAINITTKDKKAVEWLIDMAPLAGIGTSETYSKTVQKVGYNPGGEYYTLNFIKTSLTDDFFVHDKKLKRWREHSTASVQSPKYFTVKDVRFTGKYENVWCIVEPKNAAFVIEGNILTHNCTISVKENQWRDVGNWMWKNRDYYTAISVLPYNGGTYRQAPFEDCSKETYESMLKALSNIDLTKVVETEDLTQLQEQAACAGGACEIV